MGAGLHPGLQDHDLSRKQMLNQLSNFPCELRMVSLPLPGEDGPDDAPRGSACPFGLVRSLLPTLEVTPPGLLATVWLACH